MAPSFQSLFLLANAQQGYFTASQAARLGYSQQNQAHHVSVGNWKRVKRGIFRLEHYPTSKNPDLIVTHLWALDINDQPEGVFSYETALQFYELSDWTGYGLHMTVPKNFRRRSQSPFRLALHKDNLDPQDIQKRDCFLVTTPIKTILDLLFAGVIEQRFLKQALIQGLDRGLISGRQLQRRKLTGAEAAKVSWLLELAGVDDVKIS